jgi:hypothetical protein
MTESAPGPDFTGEIAAAMAVPGLAGVPNLPGVNVAAAHYEYRVSPEGDVTPTSGATLDQVLSAGDAPGEGPGSAAEAQDAAVEAAPNPVDVSTMGGGTNQWWVSPEDAADTQRVADAVNAATPAPGADIGGAPDGYQPFPPGPDGMVAQ